MDNRLFLVASKVPAQGGGVTQVILNRARSLSQAGMQVTILSVNHEDEARRAEQQLRLLQRLPRTVECLNIFDYYRHQADNKAGQSWGLPWRKLSWYGLLLRVTIDYVWRMTDKLLQRKSGVWRHRQGGRGDGLPKASNLRYQVGFDQENGLITRRSFDGWGRLSQIEWFDVDEKRCQRIERYSPDGWAFLDSRREGDDWSVLWRPRGEDEQFFATRMAFYTAWLDELAVAETVKPFFIFDAKELAEAGWRMRQDQAFIIQILHSNHFGRPTYDKNSEVKKNRRPLLERLGDLQQLVVLTEQQRQEIADQFGYPDKVAVITNSLRPSTLQKTVAKNRRLVSMVARLESEKQVNQAIDAFAKVVKKIPEARLQIYGSGSKRKDLAAQVAKLKLKERVLLMGYQQATIIDRAYATSLVCLMTSKYEGFGLTLVEAMQHGTPFISYDLQYGPSDIAEHGALSYIVPKNDTEALADKIIWALEHADQVIATGQKARHAALQKYTEDRVTEQWMSLFENMIAKDADRP